jgi:hypothetical protein
MALLMLLEALSPVERAVFSLREVLGYGYLDVAKDHRQDRGELPAHLRPRFDLVFASRSHATKSGRLEEKIVRGRLLARVGSNHVGRQCDPWDNRNALRQQAGLTIKRFQIPAHLGEVGRIGLQHTVDDGTGHHVDQHVQVGVGRDRSLLSRPLQ